MKAPIYCLGALMLALLSIQAFAGTTIVQDNFTGQSASLNWTALNGACLTAGNNSGSVPACAGLAYYATCNSYGYGGTLQYEPQYGLTNNRDQPGNGALRFTSGYPCYQQNGAIISNFTFPSNQGLQVTFTTYTYGGDSGGGGNDGADGIGFYLLDGNQSPNLGAWGGSLGYSCSNSNAPYNGMVGAYLGLGIDEFGNFLNNGDNTATGAPSNGTNGGYGNYQPGRIGLRGYGNVSWAWLNQNYPNLYPTSLVGTGAQNQAVKNTCRTGKLWNYSNPTSPYQTKTAVADYAVIPGGWQILPANQPIALEPNPVTATPQIVRTQATPITYKLKLTQNGLLSLSYSYGGGTYRPVLTNQSISANNGPMPSSFKFGFGASDGGSDNVHELTCFEATPANLSASSAGLNVQQSGQVRTGTQVYLAYYHPDNWWGQLTAQNLLVDPTTGAVSIQSTANWDASCVLTGGNCAATGVNGMTAQTNRTLLTWSGSAGIPLAWSNLPASEQAALGGTNAQARLAYLSGNRSQELTTSGTGLFRARTSVLGDIINSSPVWVGPPSAPYPATWSDALYPTATLAENANGAQTYPAFETAEASRLNVVYDGANDGFMHGFSTGSYSSAGVYNTATNTGQEVMAYMPQAVLDEIHNATNPLLDYSSPQYAHSYFVDATPGVGDLFYNNTWHTWLVSGLGAGGDSIFALDITNPSSFSTANAANIVKGELNALNLPCATPGCGANLGQTYGTPQIRLLHNGEWAILFGDGLNNATGVAGIYVVTINSSGSFDKAYFLSTGVGTTANPDGIEYVTPVDLDGDHITDYVYAGDTQGNIWRFNLTSQSPSNWSVSTYGSGAPKPLFTACQPGGGCVPQPITTQLQVIASNPGSVLPRVMINFGTGMINPQTTTAAASYASGTQTLYGIWDWDFSTWDNLSPQRYQSLTAPQTITRSVLQQQTITSTTNATQTGAVQGYRTVSNTSVCFKGETCAGTAGTDYGWYLDLPGVNGTGATEQVVYNPTEAYGAFLVNTTVPANNSPFTCTVQSAQGWTMAINPISGGQLGGSFFANVGAPPGSIISGVALNGTGSPSIVSANQVPYLITQTVTGVGAVTKVNPQGNQSGRLTWIEVR